MSDAHNTERFEEGKQGSHSLTDPKDQRSISNRLAAEEKQRKEEEDAEAEKAKKDPTLIAKSHGNKPSRGAEIDAELAAEDEQRIREKEGK